MRVWAVLHWISVSPKGVRLSLKSVRANVALGLPDGVRMSFMDLFGL